MTDTTSLNEPFPHQFPTELLATIIRHFADSLFPLGSSGIKSSNARREEMKKLATVSKQFCGLARGYIFDCLALGHLNDTSGVRHRNLAALLEDNPHLRSYTQSVTYFFRGEVELTHNDQELSPLLQLPNVTELSAWNLHTGISGISYETTPDNPPVFNYRRVLERYIVCGNLTSIALTGFEDLPLRTLLSSRTLQKLSLFRCSIVEPELNESGEHPPATRFELKHFKEQDVKRLPLSLMTQCPQLQSLQTNAGDSARFGHPTPPTIISPPFRKLVDGFFYEGVDIPSWIQAATNDGEYNGPAFPRLKRLIVKLRWLGSWEQRGFYEDHLIHLFCNAPVLKKIHMMGAGLTEPVVKLSRSLEPVKESLKTLELDLPFFLEHGGAVKLVPRFLDFLDDFSLLRLPALEDLSINISLKIGWTGQEQVVYQILDGIQRFNSVFVSTNATNFPWLESLNIKVELFIPRSRKSRIVVNGVKDCLKAILGSLADSNNLDYTYSCSVCSSE